MLILNFKECRQLVNSAVIYITHLNSNNNNKTFGIKSSVILIVK